MTESVFSESVFSAPLERCLLFRQRLARFVDSSKALRFLDLGCGTGSQMFSLAGAWPKGFFVGVDVSHQSIRIAERSRLRKSCAERTEFHHGDYMEFQSDPFDVIYSFSSVHLIAADTKALLSKISRDLKCGGLFINVMPYECPYNKALWRARRMLRLIRNPFIKR